eukprot:10496676-Alexandrium_andersonii.AAC.1
MLWAGTQDVGVGCDPRDAGLMADDSAGAHPTRPASLVEPAPRLDPVPGLLLDLRGTLLRGLRGADC